MDLSIRRGEVLALIGPSGSGKTTVAKAILRILPPSARVEGSVELDGLDILRLSSKDMMRIRWVRISYIPQGSSRTYLNPTKKLIKILKDLYMLHGRSFDPKDVKELLEEIGLDWKILERYPHELSGGQLQRVLIAVAAALNPEYIIADEPTSALDVITQSQIVDIIRRLAIRMGTGILLITHDIVVASSIANRVAVMHRGRIIEEGSVEEILRNPHTEIARSIVEGSLSIGDA